MHLLEIIDVGADAKRDAAVMLDFHVREIELSLAAGEQANPRALLSESDRKTFSDASTTARDENVLIVKVQP